MAITNVAGVAGTAGGTNGGATANQDTTGASFYGAAIAFDSGATGTLVDNDADTVSLLTQRGSSTPPFNRLRIGYVAAPTAGANKTMTVGPALSFGAVAFLAFAGTHATPFDQQNGGEAAAAETISTGSITPSENNCLIIAALGIDAVRTIAIDSSFSTPVFYAFAGGTNYGVYIAYKIQTTAAAINPAWSWTGGGNTNATAAIASFKAAAAAGSRASLLGGKLVGKGLTLKGLVNT